MEKTTKDYVKEIQKEFPMFSEKEINDIMLAGFRRLHYFIKLGCDIFFKSSRIYGYLIYFGNLTFNSAKHFRYYDWKYARRLRVLWNLNKLNREWNGYYYFGLTDSKYEEVFNSGRKKKFYTFEHLRIYKIFDELTPKKRYTRFYRIKGFPDIGFTYYLKSHTLESPEYIGYREKDKIIKLINYSFN